MAKKEEKKLGQERTVVFSDDLDTPTHGFKKGKKYPLKMSYASWGQVEEAAERAEVDVKYVDTPEPKKRAKPARETATDNPQEKGAETATK